MERWVGHLHGAAGAAVGPRSLAKEGRRTPTAWLVEGPSRGGPGDAGAGRGGGRGTAGAGPLRWAARVGVWDAPSAPRKVKGLALAFGLPGHKRTPQPPAPHGRGAAGRVGVGRVRAG